MKYRKNGRTYRGRCVGRKCFMSECLDRDDDTEPYCFGVGARNGWRETLFSKIRNWRRKG